MTEQIILTDINAFYEEYIKGHTSEELQLGNTFCLNAWNEFMANANLEKNRYSVLDAYLISDEFLQKCVVLSGLTKDHVRELIFFSRDFSFYSDWYKDEYGFRPHIL